MTLLLEHGADVDQFDYYKTTALHKACALDSALCIEALVNGKPNAAKKVYYLPFSTFVFVSFTSLASKHLSTKSQMQLGRSVLHLGLNSSFAFFFFLVFSSFISFRGLVSFIVCLFSASFFFCSFF